jgi:hypothetical protein
MERENVISSVRIREGEKKEMYLKRVNCSKHKSSIE